MSHGILESCLLRFSSEKPKKNAFECILDLSFHIHSIGDLMLGNDHIKNQDHGYMLGSFIGRFFQTNDEYIRCGKTKVSFILTYRDHLRDLPTDIFNHKITTRT